ncbi:MAG TPA: ferritin-like domain-containing protein [Acidimicrobiales bacterium]|nr:ferritin-like domain-containing protein [Acidimicrobiales bacterium]
MAVESMDNHDDHVPNPNRRRFLALGGAVAGAAVVAACGPSGGPVAHTGNQPVTSSTLLPPRAPSTSEALTGSETDQSVLQTATSLELLLVSFYDDITSKGWIKDPAAIQVIKQFSQHHSEHAHTMQDATTKAGGKAYDKANAVLSSTLLQPKIQELQNPAAGTTDQDWIAFCQALEDIASATYTADAAELGTPELRQAAMSVGATEARHRIVFAQLLTPNDPSQWVPASKQAITNAIGSDAAVGAKS